MFWKESAPPLPPPRMLIGQTRLPVFRTPVCSPFPPFPCFLIGHLLKHLCTPTGSSPCFPIGRLIILPHSRTPVRPPLTPSRSFPIGQDNYSTPFQNTCAPPLTPPAAFLLARIIYLVLEQSCPPVGSPFSSGKFFPPFSVFLNVLEGI